MPTPPRRPGLAGPLLAGPVLVALAILAGATPAGAHGVAGAGALPAPPWLLAYGAGAALVLSWVALGLGWPRARLAAAVAGRPLPRWTAPAATAALVAGRAVVLVAFLGTLAAAALGDRGPLANPAPVVVLLLAWIGVPLACALVGPVWASLSPYDTLAALARAARRRPAGLAAPAPAAPAGARLLPAAVGLAAYTWYQLAAPDASSPRVLAVALGAYSAAVLGGAAVRGRAWLRTGEALTAWTDLVGAAAPLARGDDGRVRVRPPVAGLAALPDRPGAAALVLVVLGATLFDALSGTRTWIELVGTRTGWAAAVVDTVGLAWVVAVVTVAHGAAVRVVAGRGGTRDAVGRVLTTALVPVSLALVVAHGLGAFVFEAPQALALASDPLGRGWDLLGTADAFSDLGPPTVAGLAWAQLAVVVLGHGAGLLSAHDRSLALLPRPTGGPGRWPLAGAVVALSVGGLGLVLGAAPA